MVDAIKVAKKVSQGHFDVEKRGLRVEILENSFYTKVDDLYLQQLLFSEFFYWIIKNSQKVSKTTQFCCFWHFLALFDNPIKKLWKTKLLQIKIVNYV